MKDDLHDKDRFGKLMEFLYQGSGNTEPLSAIRKKIYFAACLDLEFEDVAKNGVDYLRRTGWMPKIPELRGEDMKRAKAIQDFEYVTELYTEHYRPELGTESQDIIENIMIEAGREDLVEPSRKWAREIVYGKRSVVRAQWVESRAAGENVRNRQQLDAGDTKRLNGLLNKMLLGVGDKK